jgi:hypothetical protein
MIRVVLIRGAKRTVLKDAVDDTDEEGGGAAEATETGSSLEEVSKGKKASWTG